MPGEGINRQIDAYSENRALKQHESEMIALIREKSGGVCSSVLDLGCADGLFLARFVEEFRTEVAHGVELDGGLAARAQQRIGTRGRVFCVPAQEFDTGGQRYDCIVASGMLSIFSDPGGVLRRWTNWLTADGSLYVFGRFNSQPIDTQILFRNHYKASSEWEGGLTSFSLEHISRHLENDGYEVEARRFTFDGELAPSPDPIRTFTVELANGSKLVLNGANVVAEHFFVIVTRQIQP